MTMLSGTGKYAAAVGYIMAIIIFILTVINMKVAASLSTMSKEARRDYVKSLVQAVVRSGLTHAVLLAGAVIMILPFFWMVTTSLKEMWEVFTPEMQWLPEVPVWRNYADAWMYAPFGRYYFNTIFVAVSVVVLQLIICGLAAYALSRLQFPGRDIIFLGVLGTMMLPGTLMTVPSYLILHWLKWIDTYYALIIPSVFNAFGIFLLRQFFMTIPRELDDAATIDGCSRIAILWRIIMPLSKAAFATIGIFTFMGQWNSYIWP